ncbi:MAG: DNA-3-methyladenine glycosylase [Rhodococcus sp. (in: high G+C Gram-positive bacteria)]
MTYRSARAALESADPVGAAMLLLGGVLRCGDVALEIVETEAYGGGPDGPWPDPASHSFRGRTQRTSVMFGPSGHLYIYRSYGIHLCINVVCGPDDDAAAVLIRAGDVVDGMSSARRRRPAASATSLARGPGNVGSALGVDPTHNGCDLLDPNSAVTLVLPDQPVRDIGCGPRVGVSRAADRHWRFWSAHSPSVSAYRRSPRATETENETPRAPSP